MKFSLHVQFFFRALGAGGGANGARSGWCGRRSGCRAFYQFRSQIYYLAGYRRAAYKFRQSN